MKRGALAILFIVLSAGSSSANSDLFYPYVCFQTGSLPKAVAIGDVNGDGRKDVVMTTAFYFSPESDYSLLVFLQDAYGLLEAPIVYRTSGEYSSPPVSVAIGDIDHDGRPDVVVGNSGVALGGSGKNIEVFPQNEFGTLGPSRTYATSNSESISIADLNNDGLLDVVGVGDGNSVDVFLQDRNGGLYPPTTYTMSFNNPRCTKVATGDIDDDGLTDIAVMNSLGCAIAVLLQKADGTLGNPVHYYLNEYQLMQGMAVGDVGRDRRQEVVVAYGGNRPDSRIGLLFQNDSGSLDPVEVHPSSDIPTSIAIADVNHDGGSDVVVAHSAWTTLGVYLRNGSGGLMLEELYSLPYSDFGPHAVAADDINGDGFNDVVIATPTTGLTVLYNRKGPAIPRIAVSHESLNFGSLFADETSTLSFSLYNMGTAQATIQSVEISGPDAAEFELIHVCAPIEPGATDIIAIRYTARSEGPKFASVRIVSNDYLKPTRTVELFAYVGRHTFGPMMTHSSIMHGQAVAIGDVNGDGRNDVVMTSSYPYDRQDDRHRLHVYLQNSLGLLDTPVSYLTSSAFYNEPISIGIGDLNNDGKADIAVGNQRNDIEVFLQSTEGGLAPGQRYSTPNSASLKIGDLNNDGLLDVVSIGSGASLDVFLQNRNGALDTPVPYEVVYGTWESEVEIGDINHDGLNDIVIKGLAVLLQNRRGTFDPPVYYDIRGNGIAVADVNGDNLQDIILSSGGNQPSSTIAVALQGDSGNLDWLTSYGSYDVPGPVVVTDINNDNRTDVLVAHEGFATLGVYVQESMGWLMPERLYSIQFVSHLNPQGLAAGDINGDGFNDAAIADSYGLTILYNIARSRCIPPSIVSQPENQTVLYGRTASMAVNVSGTWPFSYQWYMGTDPQTSHMIWNATSTSYTTPSLMETENYWVAVSNACGTVNSNTATIRVVLGMEQLISFSLKGFSAGLVQLLGLLGTHR